MNWARGLFRAWLLISTVWVLLVGYFASDVFLRPLPFGGNFQYSVQVKEMPWNTDWSKPLYEISYPPGKGRFPDSFATLDDEYLQDWDKRAKTGELIKVEFPDGSMLYLASAWTDNDKNLLSKEFWDQRWYRYLQKIGRWLGLALAPPAALLVLGCALRWVLRGFRSSAT
jgi:hypothetical protein